MLKNVKSENTTIATPHDIEKIECNDIGNRFERKCPKCGSSIVYAGNRPAMAMKRAIDRNTVCSRCAQLGLKHPNRSSKSFKRGKDHWNFGNKMPPESIKKMQESMMGKTSSSDTRHKMKLARLGKVHSSETRLKISKANLGRKLSNAHKELIRNKALLRFSDPTKNPMFGKHHTWATKAKLRTKYINRLNRIYGSVIVPNYNDIGCRIIDEYSKALDTTFQHAENGGEFTVNGYFVDGYSKGKNIVIEIDEPRHFKNERLRENNVQRMREIKTTLGCKFIRIRYNKDGSFSEYLNEVTS